MLLLAEAAEHLNCKIQSTDQASLRASHVMAIIHFNLDAAESLRLRHFVSSGNSLSIADLNC